MNLVSLSEDKNFEKRIAITPEIAKKYINLGFNLYLPSNYGNHLGFSDYDYKNLGVNVLDDEKKIISNANLIIQLNLPNDQKLSFLKENQTLIGSLNSNSNKEKKKRWTCLLSCFLVFLGTNFEKFGITLSHDR